MQDLWQAAVNGDKQAEDKIFTILSERFLVITRFTIYSEDARDIVQDTCMAIKKGYKEVGNPYEYNAWAMKILRNKIANYFQKKSIEKQVISGTDPRELDSFTTGTTSDPDLMRSLKSCLHQLRQAYPRYAQALHLIQTGYTSDEICKRLNISKNNLYVILNRGRTFLRNCLAEREKKL